MKVPNEIFAALNRLFLTAESRTEGAEHIASFLLAWANYREYGGFNLASLARLDSLVIKDIQVVTNALFDYGFFRLSDLGFGPRIQNISRVYQEEISAQRSKRNQRARANSWRRQLALSELLSYLHENSNAFNEATAVIASMNMRQMRAELHRLTGMSYMTTEDMEALIREARDRRNQWVSG